MKRKRFSVEQILAVLKTRMGLGAQASDSVN